MTHTITYNTQDMFVEAKFAGEIDKLIGQTAMEDILTELAQHHCLLLLSDLSEAKIHLSTIDIFALPAQLTELAAQRNINPKDIHQAIVGKKSMLLKFFDDVFYNRGYKVAYFEDRAQAKAWLLGSHSH